MLDRHWSPLGQLGHDPVSDGPCNRPVPHSTLPRPTPTPAPALPQLVLLGNSPSAPGQFLSLLKPNAPPAPAALSRSF